MQLQQSYSSETWALDVMSNLNWRRVSGCVPFTAVIMKVGVAFCKPMMSGGVTVRQERNDPLHLQSDTTGYWCHKSRHKWKLLPCVTPPHKSQPSRTDSHNVPFNQCACQPSKPRKQKCKPNILVDHLAPNFLLGHFCVVYSNLKRCLKKSCEKMHCPTFPESWGISIFGRYLLFTACNKNELAER